MEQDFEDFIAVRCERALEENEYYMNAEAEEKLTQDELQVLAERLCYKKGYSDAMATILETQKCSQIV